MTWLEQWRALAARIDGLLRAGEFLAAALKVNSRDNFYIVEKMFLPSMQEINDEIEYLLQQYVDQMPPKAAEAAKRCIGFRWGRSVGSGEVDLQQLAAIAAFRSEFEYLVRDSEVEGRNLAELAFEHLRRQLVVDEDVRKKWGKAFEKHETACEKLGAVHLLSHGIWAFKVQGIGAATDLVFNDSVASHLEIVRRTARALVLTEWKLVKNQKEIQSRAQQARTQADNYGAGVLGDTELKRTRFVVLVCKSDQPAPEEIAVGDITYRHIVLPITSRSPSAAARRQAHS